ncbi:MAG TPA: copper-binding protein, partial [Sphingomicrobium sp.]|nr:copper-binding protein [Sphingomicrobium sp.]
MRCAFLLAVPIALLAAQPAAPQPPAAVNVQLENFKFTPNTIVLDHDRPYVLRLFNASGGGHDFSAPAFFAASAIAPSDRRWVTEGEVEVPAG